MELKIKCPGYEIAADWYEGSDPDNILVVLPGYSSSKLRQKSHAKAIVQATGTCAMVVDFSGHGKSPFKLRDTCPAQHFLELVYVFDWLKRKCPGAIISVSGASYGGYLAVQLTRYREFANLILRVPAIYKPSAFYDLWSTRIDDEKTYATKMAEYRKDRKALANHPLLGRVSAFKGRALVVVHENDELIPTQTTDAYIKAFNADSFIAEDFPHIIDSGSPEESLLPSYDNRIAEWLKSA